VVAHVMPHVVMLLPLLRLIVARRELIIVGLSVELINIFSIIVLTFIVSGWPIRSVVLKQEISFFPISLLTGWRIGILISDLMVNTKR
jgi:hypothetical protein